MIEHFINRAEAFQRRIAYLKSKSPIYPEIFQEQIGGTYWLSSLVHFVYNGVEFSRHHVESCVGEDWVDNTRLRLIEEAKLTIENAIPLHRDNVVGVVEIK